MGVWNGCCGFTADVEKFARAMKRMDDEWKRMQYKSPLTKRILRAQKNKDSNWPGTRRSRRG